MDQSTGYCTVCPKKCHWSKHKCTDFYYEWYSTHEENEIQDVKQNFFYVKNDKKSIEVVLKTEISNNFKWINDMQNGEIEDIVKLQTFMDEFNEMNKDHKLFDNFEYKKGSI